MISLPAAAVVTLFLVTLAPYPSLTAASTSLNSVLLTAQTSGATPISSYNVMAYNASGWPVATYQGQFGQVAFQLPAGKYLFAVDASGPSPKQPCVYQGGVATGAPTAPNAQGAGPAIIYPCAYNPVVEYGYSLTQVTGPTTVTISTQPPSNLPTASATVTLDYKNGTAVAGAQVSASVVGAGYYWGNDQKLSMYAQTGKDGVAHLTVPVAPLVISGWKSVPVIIPKSQTTVQVNVGGQLVNVTVYYSPSYVYLHGTSLIVPPQTSASMTLTAEPSNPIIPYGVATPGMLANGAGAGVAVPPSTTGAAQVQGAPETTTSNVAQSAATTIPPLPADVVAASSPATAPSTSQTGLGTNTLLAAGAIGLVALALAIGLAVSRMKRGEST